MHEGIDFIGDVHGHAASLERLLRKLGYDDSDGVYHHPSRSVMFVGDFIDGGPDSTRVIELARTMVSQGEARAVMGNHEYNAIAYHTPDPEQPGAFLRPHTAKNLGQHRTTLEEFADHPAALTAMIDWFQTLPLFLEVDGARVVHACWDPASIESLKIQLGPGNTLTNDLLIRSARRGSDEHAAVEQVLKGAEMTLPDGAGFADKYGHIRHEARIRWWMQEADSLHDMVIGPPDLYDAVAGHPAVKDALMGYGSDEAPVFFGHYWLRGMPQQQQNNAACLDYSIAKDGKLVAYRWDGERRLKDDHFVWVA